MNLLVVCLFLVTIYYLFIVKHQSEKFSGVGSENPFTNLTCLHENPDDTNSPKHVFKVSPSLNFSQGNYTFHKVNHPDRLSKTDGTQYINYDDVVNSGDTPKCKDGEFSTYFVKKIRDETSKARTLFNKINAGQTSTNKSTWQQHECTVTDLNNKSHWCNKLYNTISNNVDKLCSTKPGDVPANYCNNFKDEKLGVKAYINTNDKLVNQINYLQQRGADSITQKIRNVGAVPQEATLDNGEYNCFKNNNGKDVISTGSMCYNIDSTKNITPYAPTNQNKKIMCNPGDILNSTVSDGSSICSGEGLFDKIESNKSRPTFGTVLNKHVGNRPLCKNNNDTNCCTSNLIGQKLGRGGFCVRPPTTDEINSLQKTKWYSNFTDQFASASV